MQAEITFAFFVDKETVDYYLVCKNYSCSFYRSIITSVKWPWAAHNKNKNIEILKLMIA